MTTSNQNQTTNAKIAIISIRKFEKVKPPSKSMAILPIHLPSTHQISDSSRRRIELDQGPTFPNGYRVAGGNRLAARSAFSAVTLFSGALRLPSISELHPLISSTGSDPVTCRIGHETSY